MPVVPVIALDVSRKANIQASSQGKVPQLGVSFPGLFSVSISLQKRMN